MYINMIKLKKYHIYKVYHKLDNLNYLMIYLGKRTEPKIYQDKEVKQAWGIGSIDTIANRITLRKSIYRYKKFNTNDFNLTAHHSNHEHTLDVLEEIPLSSIKVPLSALQPPTISPTNSLKSSYLKPKKDYSKMRVINL